jgi:hypothetical protein
MLLRRDRKVLPVGSVLRHPLVLGRCLIRGAIQAVRAQGDEDRMGIPWRQAEQGERHPRLARALCNYGGSAYKRLTARIERTDRWQEHEVRRDTPNMTLPN